MPQDLELLVDRMIADGKSEEDIATIIGEYQKREKENVKNEDGTIGVQRPIDSIDHTGEFEEDLSENLLINYNEKDFKILEDQLAPVIKNKKEKEKELDVLSIDLERYENRLKFLEEKGINNADDQIVYNQAYYNYTNTFDQIKSVQENYQNELQPYEAAFNNYNKIVKTEREKANEENKIIEEKNKNIEAHNKKVAANKKEILDRLKAKGIDTLNRDEVDEEDLRKYDYVVDKWKEENDADMLVEQKKIQEQQYIVDTDPASPTYMETIENPDYIDPSFEDKTLKPAIITEELSKEARKRARKLRRKKQFESLSNSVRNASQSATNVWQFLGFSQLFGGEKGAGAQRNIGIALLLDQLNIEPQPDGFLTKLLGDQLLELSTESKEFRDLVAYYIEEESKTGHEVITLKDIKSKEKKHPGDYLAWGLGTLVSGGGSLLEFLGTRGFSFFSMYATDSYISINQEKAKMEDKEFFQFLEENPDDVEKTRPLIVAAVSTGLERFAVSTILGGVVGKGKIGGITNNLSKKISEKIPNKLIGSRARRVVDSIGVSFIEGETEWLQGATQEFGNYYSKFLDQGMSKAEATKAATNSVFAWMTSDEGLEQMYAGFISGGGMRGGGHVVNALRNNPNTNIDANLEELVKLEKKKVIINESSNPDAEVLDGIQSKIDEQLSIIRTRVKQGEKIVENLSKDDLRELTKQNDVIDATSFKMDKLNKKLEKGKIKQTDYNIAIEGLVKNKNQALQKIEAVTINQQIKEIDEGQGKVKIKTTEELQNIVESDNDFENNKVDAFIKDNKELLKREDLSVEQRQELEEEIKELKEYKKDLKKQSKQASNEFGFIIQKPDGKFEIFLNEDKPAIGVAGHEFLHRVLFNTLKNDKSLQNAVGGALQNHINNELDIDSQKRLGDRLTAYGDYKLNEETNKYEFKPDDNYGEEVITLTSESLVNNDIQYDENLMTKIGDVIRRTLQDKLGKEVRFDTGRDVFNFIRDYNASIKKGKVSEAIKRVYRDGAQGDLIEAQNVKPAESQTSFSREANRDLDLKQEIDDHVQNTDGSRKYENKEQFRNSNDFIDAYNTLVNTDALDGLIRRGMMDRGLPANMLNDFTRKVKEKIGERFIKNFDPAKNTSLFGWLAGKNPIIYRAKGDVINEYKKEISTVRTDITETTQVAAEQDIEQRRLEEKDITKKDVDIKPKTFLNTINIKPEVVNKINKVINASDIDLTKISYKDVKKLLVGKDAPLKEVLNIVSNEFGIPAAKILKNQDLTTEQRTVAQNFIKNNTKPLINMLPEGSTVSGKATGISRTLLKPFYNKGERVKMSETGNPQGLAVQVKKDNITNEQFKSAFGINPDGTLQKGTGKDGIIRSLVTQAAMITANQGLRSKAIQEAKTPMSVIALVGDGKSSIMFSKDSKNKDNKNNLLRKTGAIDADLNDADKTIFWDNMPEMAALSVLETDIESVKTNLKSIYGNYPSIIKNIDNLADGIYKAIKGFDITVKKQQQLETKSDQLFQKLLELNAKQSKVVAAFTGITTPVSTTFMTKPDEVNKMTATIRTHVQSLFDPNDINGFFRKVMLLKGGFASSSRASYLKRNQPYPDLKAFLADVIGSEKRTKIPGLKYKLETRIDKNGRVTQTIESVTYKGKPVKLDLKLVSQSSNKALNDAKNWNKSKINRRKNEKEALNVLNDYVVYVSKLFNDGKIDNTQLAMHMSSLLSGTSTALYRAAALKYIGKGAFNVKNPGKDLEYEHMQPRVKFLIGLFNEHINKGGVDNITEFAKNYQIQVVSKEFNKVLTENGLQSALFTGQTLQDPSWIRNYNSKTIGDKRITSILDIDNDLKELKPGEAYIKAGKIFADKKKKIQAYQKFSKAKRNHTPVTQEAKGITVLDFDDTLATTKSLVKFTTPDGKTGTLNAKEYASKYEALLEEGYKFDFSDFNKVVDAKLAPLFNKALKLQNKFGPENMFILTARPEAAQKPIFDFLKAKGLNIPLKNITGLGDSTAEAKALWVADKVGEGYNDFYFADDALQNVQAVKNILDQFDVKSKVQQAKLKFSKEGGKQFDNILNEGKIDLDSDFNIILEQTKGVAAEKEFSAAKARQRGLKKGKFKFFVPPSADDFAGLCYSFLGKGKQGEKHHKFFKEKLFDPFSKGIRMLNLAKQTVANDLRNLKKAMPEVKKSLKKEINGTEYNNEQAIRVYIWDKAGEVVPGLTKTDKNKLVKAVEKNPELKAFADAVDLISSKLNGYILPDNDWFAGTISTDLNEASQKARSFFIQEWIDNKNIIFSDKNINKIEAVYGPNFKEALQDVLFRMEAGTNRRSRQGRIAGSFTNWINGSVATVMFVNMRSAILQTLSTVNFINWHDNNPLKAAKAFANVKQYSSDFAMIFNSNFLKQRRSGLQQDVNAREMAEVLRASRNPSKAAVSYLLKLGFKPTQMADSFAIAAGGSTFYRNRVNTYLKQGLTQKQAEDKAFIDFQEIAEETQQSARPDRISQQQASPLGKFLLAFQNTPMQYVRIMKKAALDLVAGRGDAKTHISKIIYYGAVQNLIFYGMQQALFAVAFGDDEEEEKTLDKKKGRIINGMLDTILRGSGIAGAVVSTLKNMVLEFKVQQEKFQPDHAYTIIEGLNLSPPIGIKARKVYSGFQTWEFDEDIIRYMPLTDIDNPIYPAVFDVTEALTNVPVSRAYTKMNNIRAALDSDNETWERVALSLGWSTWNLGIENQELIDVENEIARIKKLEKQKKKEEKIKAVEQSFIEQQKKEKAEGKKDITCAAVNKNGQRCGLPIVGEGKYCTIHQKVEQGDKEVQCKKIKSDGKRCKMKTKNKSGLCYYHD